MVTSAKLWRLPSPGHWPTWLAAHHPGRNTEPRCDSFNASRWAAPPSGPSSQIKHISHHSGTGPPRFMQVKHRACSFPIAKYVERLISAK
jgi:hypothetical protein